MKEDALAELAAAVGRRLAMLAEYADEELLLYSVKKSLQAAADYCNLSGAEYFPPDARLYLIEYAAGEFLLENTCYSPRWEKLRRDGEIGLLRFRRVRW